MTPTRNTVDVNGDLDIDFTRWHDKRDVYSTRSRFAAVLASVLNMILDYDRHIGGVDNMNQFRAYYDVGSCGNTSCSGLYNFARGPKKL